MKYYKRSMNSKILLILSLFMHLIYSNKSNAQTFSSPFPSSGLLDKISSERFPGSDAIIILKEQSIQVTEGYSVINKTMIVKLLTETAVQKYGTFELEFYQIYTSYYSFKNKFIYRVLKPDSTIEDIDPNEVKNIFETSSGNDRSLLRKSIIKIPNLKINDVLQIEHSIIEPRQGSAEIFYYNDDEIVLTSKLNLTVQKGLDVKFYSIPENKINGPQVNEYGISVGVGKTYSWTVNNLPAIIEEPFSLSFESQSMITAFVIKESNGAERRNWNDLIKHYNHYFSKSLGTRKERLTEFANQISVSDSTVEFIDTLYHNLRNYFILKKENEIYPNIRFVDDILTNKKGNASDLSFVFSKILETKNIKTNFFFIKDKRFGIFEKTIPTLGWFNRIGTVVYVGQRKLFYDFDTSISNIYDLPWYLKGTEVVIAGKDSAEVLFIPEGSKTSENSMMEIHSINFFSEVNLRDSLNIFLKGFKASQFRDSYEDAEESEIKSYLENIGKQYFVGKVDSVWHNDFIENQAVNLGIKGKSKNEAESIDSFLVVKLENKLFKEFRNLLNTTNRKNDIVFDGPFQFDLIWRIQVPDQYSVKTELKSKQISGPGNAKALVSFSFNDDVLIKSVKIKFPEAFIGINEFPLLQSFIEYSNNELEKDILFVKK